MNCFASVPVAKSKIRFDRLRYRALFFAAFISYVGLGIREYYHWQIEKNLASWTISPGPLEVQNSSVTRIPWDLEMMGWLGLSLIVAGPIVILIDSLLSKERTSIS